MDTTQMGQAFWESFSDKFAGTFGESMGGILRILLTLVMFYILWGSISEQLISKTGYKGNGYRRLLVLLWSPVVVVLSQAIFGQYSDITTAVGIAALVSVYIGLAALAFFPWPVHKELRQLRKQLGTNPGQSVT